MSATPQARYSRVGSHGENHAAAPGRVVPLADSLSLGALSPATPVRSILRHPPRGIAQLVTANAGDHALILDLLRAVYQGPSLGEYHSSLDEPQYEPSDRLLIKIDSQIVSHVQLVRQIMQFGRVHLPVSEVAWLAALPEYGGGGYVDALLAAADEQMLADGAVLATLRTKTPDWFERAGWVVCSQEGYWRASARDLLAQLTARRVRRKKRPRYRTRIWRHVEISSLMDIYQQQTAQTYGPRQRSEAYWQWLISRKAFDQIVVAIEGKDSFDFGEQGPKIVAYAVAKKGRVVELMSLPGHRRAARAVLARTCREAIEHDHHTVFLHGMRDDPLGKHWLDAGGTWHASAEAAGGDMMVKLLDPRELVHRLYPEFHSRARAAGLKRPCEFGLSIDNVPYRFVLTRRSARLVSGDSRQIDVACTTPQFTRMLTGQLDRARADDQPRIAHSADAAALDVLFPRVTCCRSPLDDLQA